GWAALTYGNWPGTLPAPQGYADARQSFYAYYDPAVATPTPTPTATVSIVATPTATPTSTPGSNQMTIGANFWNIEWGYGWSDYFASGVDWSTTTNPWNPTFISEMQAIGYKCLRFMDWVPTNGSNVTSWSQRRAKTDNHYSGEAVAYEWQIDLCNRIGADIWVNVPHQADENYSYQLALLLRDTLREDLKIYVEWSNEVWNGGIGWGFPQAEWVLTHQIPGLPENLTRDGRTVYVDGTLGSPHIWNNYVYYACRAIHQFDRVFGASNTRVVRVIAGQCGYLPWQEPWYAPMCDYHIAALNNSTINPWGVACNAYAVAPYWHGSSVDECRADLTNKVNELQYHRNALTGTNIKLIAYEGGGFENSVAVNSDPGQYQLHIDGLNAFASKLQGVFCYYTHTGRDGSWYGGLKAYTGQPDAEAHKWRGVMQWLSTH
ncbi:MAG: hypothetical protein ACM3WV_10470, partial [Bacillota bacterium]